jgi:hypothetical protein
MQKLTIVIAIVIIVLVSSMASGTFSFAFKTITGAQPTKKAFPFFSKRAPSQIINRVAHNATNAVDISCITKDAANAEFLWKHVYDNKRLEVVDPKEPCITVTGTVYSKPGPPGEQRTNQMAICILPYS